MFKVVIFVRKLELGWEKGREKGTERAIGKDS